MSPAGTSGPVTVSPELKALLRQVKLGRSLDTLPERLALAKTSSMTHAEFLELEWSPEKIAVHLRAVYPDRPSWHVCHETIYQALYHSGKGGLSRQLTRRLRTGRPLRKRRRRPDQRRIRFIAPARLIDHRPPVVELRSRVGDWEGDLIIGRLGRSAIGTLVERTSRYLKLIHLPDGHSAELLRLAIAEAMTGLPVHTRLTLTWDQGSEMARHDQIAGHFSQEVFFAHPGRPWQRGSNENMNALLRQYFPKRADLTTYTPPTTLLPSRTASTSGRGRHSAGRHQPRSSNAVPS